EPADLATRVAARERLSLRDRFLLGLVSVELVERLSVTDRTAGGLALFEAAAAEFGGFCKHAVGPHLRHAGVESLDELRAFHREAHEGGLTAVGGVGVG